MTKRSHKKKEKKADPKTAFLAVYEINPDVTECCRRIGIARSMHYRWLDDDVEYAIRFKRAHMLAGGALRDDAVNWARKGLFEPIFYKGKLQFAHRERTRCLLADGTECFEEDLPKGVKVAQRRTVLTPDGEMLGVYRRSERILLKLLAAHIPDEFGPQPLAVKATVEISTSDDAAQALISKLAGWAAARSAERDDTDPDAIPN